MPTPARLLVVDDDPGIVAALVGIFTLAGHQVSSTTDPRAAAALYAAHEPDAVVLDVTMPEHDGFAVLDELRALDPDACVLMLTGNGDIESAVQAMRSGAENFLTKPFVKEHLLLTLERALAQAELRRAHRLRDAQARADEQTAELVLGRPVVRLLEILARKRSPILIHGERGTGRRLAATLLHRLSDRADQPLLQLRVRDVNDTALRATLVGSDGQPGLVRLAQRGTFVLLGVESLAPAIQELLVRLFGDRDGVDASRNDGLPSAAARLIAVTNVDPARNGGEHPLARAFVHLFGALPVQLPPLRDRGRDTIVALAEHTVRAGFVSTGLGPARLTGGAIDALLAHSWPGNLSELEDVIATAVLLAAHEDAVDSTHVQQALTESASPATVITPVPSAPTPPTLRTLSDVERDHVAAVMQAVRGNVSEAARVLGITRTTLYKKLRDLDDRP